MEVKYKRTTTTTVHEKQWNILIYIPYISFYSSEASLSTLFIYKQTPISLRMFYEDTLIKYESPSVIS